MYSTLKPVTLTSNFVTQYKLANKITKFWTTGRSWFKNLLLKVITVTLCETVVLAVLHYEMQFLIFSEEHILEVFINKESKSRDEGSGERYILHKKKLICYQ